MPTQETEELRGNESREMGGNAKGAKIDPATELPPPDETLAESAAAAESSAGGATEIDRLKTERDQLLDRLARMQAEFENARRRAEREKADFRDHVTGSVVEQFLPVLDNFELALKSAGSAEQLRAGVSLIVKQMEEALEKMQVRAIPALGEEFDSASCRERHHECQARERKAPGQAAGKCPEPPLLPTIWREAPEAVGRPEDTESNYGGLGSLNPKPSRHPRGGQQGGQEHLSESLAVMTPVTTDCQKDNHGAACRP